MCQVSRVTCQVSRVTCFFYFLKFFFNKVVKLIGGGSVINGASPSSFVMNRAGLIPYTVYLLLATFVHSHDISYQDLLLE